MTSLQKCSKRDNGKRKNSMTSRLENYYDSHMLTHPDIHMHTSNFEAFCRDVKLTPQMGLPQAPC